MVTINQLAKIVMKVANKDLAVCHVQGPQGVRGRNSHNQLIRDKLGWEPKMTLGQGIGLTYPWVHNQVELARGKNS
jgi:nucleoside-diphosphate-sugar epimerase